MEVDRRKFVLASVSIGTTLSLGLTPCFADGMSADDRFKEFTGGAQVGEGKITLTTPQIAEDGNTVPISVTVESPMNADDYVKSVMVLADGNPNPEVVTFNFTVMSGIAAAKTRIRLARSQNILAVAKMSDGSFQMVSNPVEVTVGGCGG